MSNERSASSVRRVLYHHRTQGKAVEGVHIRGIVDALRAMGIEVDVLSLPGADPYKSPKAMSPTKQATPWMRVVSSLPEPVFELVELAYNAVAIARLLRQLRRKPADMVYERYSLFMFAGVLVSRWKKIPLLLEVNDAAFVDRVRPLFFSALARRVERWVFRNCTGLVFVSGAFRDRALATHGHMAPAIVSPNAANLAQFSPTAKQRDEARQKWRLEGSVVCGYLGAFLPWHGIDRFLCGIADRLGEQPRLKLLLVGDGPIFENVRSFVRDRQLEDRVVLTGRVAHDQVPGLLACMDMAVLPSAGDYTSPVKLFEFMACAVAPVAPDFAPIREVLVDGVTGWIFDAHDLTTAVDAVLLRSADAAELRRVGAAARAYIGRERQWSNNVRQLLEFQERLSAAPREH